MLRPFRILIGTIALLCACEDISDLVERNDTFSGINSMSDSELNSIDNIVFGYLEDYKYISVGLIYEGEIQLTRSYGQNRIGRTDVYASVSKPVTSTILAQLLEEGYIDSFDDPISTYSDKYKGVMPEAYKNTPLTFAHLLSHQGGIPHHDRIWSGGKLNLAFAPGSDMMYSTRGYGIIGEVMSEITGLSYRKLVKEYIGDPVGAPSFSVPDLLFEAPGGLVVSSIKDMARFAKGMLDNTYVSDSIKFHQLWALRASHEIGLGWYLGYIGTDQLTVYHAGNNGFPRAFIALRPYHDLGVVLMWKHQSADGDQRFYQLSRELLTHLEDRE